MPDENEISNEIDRMIDLSKNSGKMVFVDLINIEMKLIPVDIKIDLELKKEEKPITTIDNKRKKSNDVSGLF